MSSNNLIAAHGISQPFLDGLADGKLRYQACAQCNRAQSLSRYACVQCRSDSLEWRDAAGAGKVIAITTVFRAPSEEFRALTPYALALVQLDEGPRVFAHVDRNASVGHRVSFDVFVHGGRPLAYFRLAD
jgi:uncharacterized OB-fold protein